MDNKILTPFEAYKGDEEFIFISYSHSEVDRDLVFRDIKLLNDLNYNIWYDEGIRGGDRWTLAITDNLKKASKIILFISPRSVLSDNIISEINIAKNIGKPILPIMIEPTEITGTEVEYLIGMRNILIRQSMSEEKYFKKVREFLDSKNPVTLPKVPIPTPVQSTNTISPSLDHTKFFAIIKILGGLSITLLIIVSVLATLYFSQNSKQNKKTFYMKDKRSLNKNGEYPSVKITTGDGTKNEKRVTRKKFSKTFKNKKIKTNSKITSEVSNTPEYKNAIKQLIKRGYTNLSNDDRIYVLLDGLKTTYSIFPFGFGAFKVPLGFLVLDFPPGSQCDIAGLDKGDIILPFGKTSLTTKKDQIEQYIMEQNKPELIFKIVHKNKFVEKIIKIDTSIIKMLKSK